MQEIVEKEFDNTANYLVQILNDPAYKHRCGVVCKEIFEPLHQISVQQINYSFDDLTSNHFICFCFPESPLIYPKSEEEAKKLWNEGATLNIQGLEKRSKFFSTICSKMGRSLGNQVTCSVYISKPDAKTFSKHTDEWIGLAIQVHGKKEFKLYEVEKESKYELSIGSWLRLDPIDIHLANATEFSIHLNFARHEKYEFATK